MKSLIPFLLFLSGSLPFVEIRAAAQQHADGHDRQLQDALKLYRQRDAGGAAKVLEPLLASAVNENNSELEALTEALLGPVYQRLGRFFDAEASYNRSISLWARLKGDNARELAGPLGNLGTLYFDAGQYSRAEKMISRALEIENSSADSSRARAMLMTNLGNVYFAEHKDALAERKGEEVLHELPPLDPDAGWGYSILGAVHLRARDFAEAERCMDQALAVWKARLNPDDARIGNGLADLATLYAVTNRPEKAESLFQQANEVFQKGGNSQAFVRRSLAEYASVEKRLGHRKEATRISKEVARLAATSAETVMSRNVIDVNAFR
jgi:tetratricopeptide (TPR) repeat protein